MSGNAHGPYGRIPGSNPPEIGYLGDENWNTFCQKMGQIERELVKDKPEMPAMAFVRGMYAALSSLQQHLRPRVDPAALRQLVGVAPFGKGEEHPACVGPSYPHRKGCIDPSEVREAEESLVSAYRLRFDPRVNVWINDRGAVVPVGTIMPDGTHMSNPHTIETRSEPPPAS